MSLIEKLILETASEEDLSLDQFIEELHANPDDWYAFRRAELLKFVDLILENVATITDASEVVPTGPTHEDLKKYFGLSQNESTPEEIPVDWHDHSASLSNSDPVAE